MEGDPNRPNQLQEGTAEANDPKRYVAEIIAPILRRDFTPSSYQARDVEISSEEHFWKIAGRELLSVVHLRGYIIADWFTKDSGRLLDRCRKISTEESIHFPRVCRPENG